MSLRPSCTELLLVPWPARVAPFSRWSTARHLVVSSDALATLWVMRSLALADIDDDDVAGMLTENETLFVEHKSNIRDEAFLVARAVCSFANTLGGWVLIGVDSDGNPSGWRGCPSSQLPDRVREALKTNRVDPVPAFAATVHDYSDHGEPWPIGLVRVYESADTPHVMGNGQVFLRSVAQDEDARRVYRAGGVETQAALLGLADRGRAGVERARDKFRPERAPLAARSVGLPVGQMAAAEDARVSLRAVPVTGDRLADWSVSHRAREALESVVQALASHPDRSALGFVPHASGLVVSARASELLADGHRAAYGDVVAVTDGAGVVGASLGLRVSDGGDAVRLTLSAMRALLVRRLLNAVVSVLESAEAYGRVLLELRFGWLDGVVEIDDAAGPRRIPSDLPIGGELMLPAAEEEVAALAHRWHADVGRAAGFDTLLP